MTYSERVANQDDRLVPELCAAGVRFATGSPATLASLRRAWRPLYAHLEHGPAGSAILQILTLRSRTAAPAVLRTVMDHPPVSGQPIDPTQATRPPGARSWRGGWTTGREKDCHVLSTTFTP